MMVVVVMINITINIKKLCCNKAGNNSLSLSDLFLSKPTWRNSLNSMVSYSLSSLTERTIVKSFFSDGKFVNLCVYQYVNFTQPEPYLKYKKSDICIFIHIFVLSHPMASVLMTSSPPQALKRKAPHPRPKKDFLLKLKMFVLNLEALSWSWKLVYKRLLSKMSRTCSNFNEWYQVLWTNQS